MSTYSVYIITCFRRSVFSSVLYTKVNMFTFVAVLTTYHKLQSHHQRKYL